MKGKRITPFKSGTDFMSWQSKNCDKCCRYENKSTNVNKARCRLAFYLDLASVTDGTISFKTGFKIGYKSYNGISGTCELKDKCNNFNKPIIRKKYIKKIDKRQTNLFEP